MLPETWEAWKPTEVSSTVCDGTAALDGTDSRSEVAEGGTSELLT